MAFVSGLAVKGFRLLPPNRHLGKMAVGTRVKWEMSVERKKIMTINKLLRSAAGAILFGAFISAMATPAFAACVTNSNGDVFCYEELPMMPAPKLEMMKVDLPPPPGHKWDCTIIEGGKKKCTPIAIMNKGGQAKMKGDFSRGRRGDERK